MHDMLCLPLCFHVRSRVGNARDKCLLLAFQEILCLPTKTPPVLSIGVLNRLFQLGDNRSRSELLIASATFYRIALRSQIQCPEQLFCSNLLVLHDLRLNREPQAIPQEPLRSSPRKTSTLLQRFGSLLLDSGKANQLAAAVQPTASSI